jgi:subtilase family serine protease
MRRSLSVVLLAVALCALVALAPSSAGAATGDQQGQYDDSVAVCGSAAPPAGTAACLARVKATKAKKPITNTQPMSTAKSPADIQSAYGLPGLNTTATPTVAVVDAYDSRTAEADLGVYRRQYGLPACTTANGCFRKVNQRGGSTMPAANAGWAAEIALDLDAVSAACPTCKVLLVEADTPSFANLGAAVNYAAAQGVAAISNSYGGSEGNENLSAYNHPGIAVTASSGDNGFGVSSPASASTVIAVGGTSLNRASTARGWSETAWSGSGSGCSTRAGKPAWQTDALCARRTLADVSAVADPNTGLSVYNSTRYSGVAGWQQFGGTSLSAPIIAAVYALGGNLSGYPAQWTYAHRDGLFDVVTGSNGSCSSSAICTAVAGFDGPTGLGTPNGLSAF